MDLGYPNFKYKLANLSSASRAVLFVVAALDDAQVQHLVVNVRRPVIWKMQIKGCLTFCSCVTAAPVVCFASVGLTHCSLSVCRFGKKNNEVVDFSGSLPSLRAVLLVVALLAVEVAVGSVVVGEGVEQAVAVLAPEAVPVVPRSL